MNDQRDSPPDRGAVLLLVLIVAIVLSLVVVALADFVAADLRYSSVVNARADTLSTAESGIDFAVARLRANQTLCATEVADSGPVGLNGSAGPSVLTGAMNEATTTLTCERLPGDFAAVAGWTVIVTAGHQSDAIKLDVGFDRQIHGPIYVSDISHIDEYVSGGVDLNVSNGDIWHRDGSACTAPLPPSALTGNVEFDEPQTRGPICTTANWNDIFAAPLEPNLGALPPGDDDGDAQGSCLVFLPGRYSSAPDIPHNATVYFRSGDYWFDDVGQWRLDGDAVVSAGHPGSSAPMDACDAARAADPNDGGTPADLTDDGIGATFYLDGDSQLFIDDGASLEMFKRRQGDHFVSIQALTTSNLASDRSLVRTWTTSDDIRLVVHGLVWSPKNRVILDNFASNTVTQLLGGVVTLRLWLGEDWNGSVGSNELFEIEPATAASDAFIRLRATSTRDGVSTTVEAIVQYRPQATVIADRVAVNSSRVVD